MEGGALQEESAWRGGGGGGVGGGGAGLDGYGGGREGGACGDTSAALCPCFGVAPHPESAALLRAHQVEVAAVDDELARERERGARLRRELGEDLMREMFGIKRLAYGKSGGATFRERQNK